MVQNPEPHSEVYLNSLSFHMSHSNKYFHRLISLLIINNQENFQTNSSLHSINTGTRTISINQIPSYLVSKKKNKFYAGIKIFNILPNNLTILKNDKTKLKATLRKHLHTHSFSL